MLIGNSSGVKFEIVRAFFFDLASYFTPLAIGRMEQLRRLAEIWLATEQVDNATNERLVRLPTDDGATRFFRRSAGSSRGQMTTVGVGRLIMARIDAREP